MGAVLGDDDDKGLFGTVVDYFTFDEKPDNVDGIAKETTGFHAWSFFGPIIDTLFWIGVIVLIFFTVKKLFKGGNKKVWIPIAVLLIIGIFIYGLIYGGTGDFFEGLGVNTIEGSTADVTIKQLFSKGAEGGETKGKTLFMYYFSEGEFGKITSILVSNAVSPFEYVFDETLGPLLGFRSFEGFVGAFIRFFTIGLVASWLTLFVLHKFESTILDDYWTRNIIDPKKRKLVSTIFGVVSATLFVIPIIGRALETITLGIFAEALPFPLNYLARIILLTVVLFVLVFTPSIIKWYIENKKKQEKLKAISDAALAFAAAGAIGKQIDPGN